MISSEQISRAKFVGRTYLGRQELDLMHINQPAASVDNVEGRAMLILSGNYIGFLPPHYAPALDRAAFVTPPGTGALQHASGVPDYYPARGGTTTSRAKFRQSADGGGERVENAGSGPKSHNETRPQGPSALSPTGSSAAKRGATRVARRQFSPLIGRTPLGCGRECLDAGETCVNHIV